MLTETKSLEKPKSLKEYNVLYVDDEVINLRIFNMAFKRSYNVFTAESGEDAINILRSEEIHLIITDQRMPGMSGTELLQNTIDEFPDIIRIILTGFADIEAIVQAVNKCKIYKYITKPYDQGDMKLTLDKALELYKVKKEKRGLIDELADINRSLEIKVKERTKELEIANKRLTDGLAFAQTMQEFMLPKEKELSQAFRDAFVVYSPKDFVGGDFYWFKHINKNGKDIKALAVVDCMGHGVAGGLLSMIGETQLGQIINEDKVPHADEVLTQLDAELRKVLIRSSTEGHGATMDVSLIIADGINNTLEFSGGKLDLVYFKDGNLERIKGTRRSVGSDWNEKVSFERHHLDLKDVTEIYMFSDGFQDQFDGANERKFGSKQLLELISNTRREDLSSQKKEISQALSDWMRDAEQVDDITLIGAGF